MYLKVGELGVDQMAVVKLVKTETSQSSNVPTNDKISNKDKSLSLLGVTDQGYVAFNFTNKGEDIAQSFGINIKKYFGQ